MQNGNVFSQPIINLQKMLQTIFRSKGMHSRLTLDGIYGAETTQAVSSFQQTHGLPVTGAVNEVTWDAIVNEYVTSQVAVSKPYPLTITMNGSSCYCQGDENCNIHLAQCMLQEIANTFKCLSLSSENGKLDEPTCLCIEQMQAMCAVPASGKLDLMTWKYLAMIYPLAFLVHQNKDNEISV